jgi:Ala-tRNA(Pro) deacylase
MPIAELKQYLDREKVRYETICHSRTYTAQETASSAHIPGKEMAKTVMVKIDGKMSMAVLPASHRVDFDLLKAATGAGDVQLAKEEEFVDLLPECDVGAMPPFGNLHGMDVYVAEELTEDDEIAFNACAHTVLIKMAYKDYERLVNPKVISMALV